MHGSNKLGKGSYGSVYLATHRLTGDERAVKVMNVDRVTSYYLRKLHTEISILKCVDHPNIVRLQDVFFGKRSVYLVTDLCRGGELFELLNAGKNEGFVFREDRASQLMRDMLSAVHYLHSKVCFPSLPLPSYYRSEFSTPAPSLAPYNSLHCISSIPTGNTAPRLEAREFPLRREELQLSPSADRFRAVETLRP